MGTSDQRGLPHKQTLNETVAAMQAEIKIAQDQIKYGELRELENKTLVLRHGKVPLERAKILRTRIAELTSRKATLVAHRDFWSLHRNAAQCFRTMAELLVLSQTAVTKKDHNALHIRLADVELCEDYLPIS
jgi:hypothetical protein